MMTYKFSFIALIAFTITSIFSCKKDDPSPSSGIPMVKTMTTTQGSWSETYIVEYDKQGRIIKHTGPDSLLLTFEYLKDKIVTKQFSYGELETITTNFLKNKLIDSSVIEFLYRGFHQHYEYASYVYSNDLLITTKSYNGDNKMSTVHQNTYLNDNRIELKSFNSEGKLNYTIAYSYDTLASSIENANVGMSWKGKGNLDSWTIQTIIYTDTSSIFTRSLFYDNAGRIERIETPTGNFIYTYY